jgi:glutamate 5-kinase
LIAKGVCNYSAEELRQVIGMKTEEVRRVLPHATDEAVHRDYLVVG